MRALLVLLTVLGTQGLAQPIGPIKSNWSPRDAKRWLRSAHRSLAPAKGGAASFAQAVGDARVVVLGGPGFGSRTVTEVKARLIEGLLDAGFDTVALPFGRSAGERLAAHVAEGRGRLDALFDLLAPWTLDTDEMLAFVRELRARNIRTPGSVRVVGYDASRCAHAAGELRGHLGTEPSVDTALRTLASPQDLAGFAWRALPDDVRKSLRTAVDRLCRSRDRDLARRAEHVRDAVRIRDLPRKSGVCAPRERALARVITGRLSTSPGSRVVVWADNGSSARRRFSASLAPMSAELARTLGARAVFTCAITFGTGRAVGLDHPHPRSADLHRVDPSGGRGLTVWKAKGPPRFSLEGLCAEAGVACGFVVFGSEVPAALKDAHLSMRWAPPAIPASSAGQVRCSWNLPRHFDALVYLGESEPARPRPSARKRAR